MNLGEYEKKPEWKVKKVQTSRTSFPEAVKAVLEALKTKKSFSINAISKETGINRRTIKKALKLLLEIQPYFQEMKLSSIESDWRKYITANEKTGLLELPENVQRLIIRTIYYPNPSKDEIVLIHLLLNDALSPQKSLSLERDRTVQRLIEQGQIVEENGRLYLSDEGKIVAQGALRLYPELKELGKLSFVCSK